MDTEASSKLLRREGKSREEESSKGVPALVKEEIAGSAEE